MAVLVLAGLASVVFSNNTERLEALFFWMEVGAAVVAVG